LQAAKRQAGVLGSALLAR